MMFLKYIFFYDVLYISFLTIHYLVQSPTHGVKQTHISYSTRLAKEVKRSFFIVIQGSNQTLY
ncbi:hypothetical protein Hanom_Chr06g00513551 [Helianthus anomalus]